MLTSHATRWTCQFCSDICPFGMVGRLRILTAAVLMTATLWSGEVMAQTSLPRFWGTESRTADAENVEGAVANEAIVPSMVNSPISIITPPATAPEIIEFTWRNSFIDVYEFTGRVLDDNPGGLTVTFGGGLQGHSTTTAADGTFLYSLILAPDQFGAVTAQTVNTSGLMSNVAQTFVY